MAFIRQHMMGMAGDPMFVTKRKSAAAGPKAKAARHRFIRTRRMMGDPFLGLSGKAGQVNVPMGPSVKKGGLNPFDFMKKMAGGIGQAAKGIAPIAKQVLGSGFLGPAGALASSLIPGGASTVSAGALASMQRRGMAPSTALGPVAAELEDFGLVSGGRGFGGKRRTMNPLNVKALKRSARRFEGFANAVRSVNRALPSGMKFNAPAIGKRPKARRKR